MIPARLRASVDSNVARLVITAVLLTACTSTARLPETGVRGLIGLGTPEERLASDKALQIAFEDSISSCMSERGWVYIADVEPAVPGAPIPGYGITFSPENDEASSAEDPNKAIVDGLSDGQQRLYSVDLYGADSEDTGSCLAIAHDAVYGAVDRALSALNEDAERIFAKMETDPRLSELEKAWAQCMKDRGYGFTRYFEIHRYLIDRLAELDSDPSGPGGLPADALAALQAEELSIYEVDVACRAPIEERQREIRREYEIALYEGNETEFDRIQSVLTGAS